MNKKVIRLLGASVIALTLASCGSTKPVERNYVAEPDHIRLNCKTLSLFEGKSQQIGVIYSPANSTGTQLNYVSSDESVASVDSNGNVTAKKAGYATIDVSYKKGNEVVFHREVPVTVVKSATYAEVVANAKAAVAMQANMEIVSVEKQEIRDNFTYVGEELQKGYHDDCNYQMYVDESKAGEEFAFMNIEGHEEQIKTREGNPEPTDYSWKFLTNTDYITTMYHISDSNKTRLAVSTQSYIGNPAGRKEPVFAILDSMFRSGREIITDNYTDALEADFLKYLYEEKNFESHCSDLGIYGNEVLRYTYTGSSTSTVSPSDEADYEIPARTMYNSRYTYEMTWVKGILKTFIIHQTMSYKIEETQYRRLTDIEFSYLVNNDVKIELPNPKEYKEVDDIFSL